MRSSPDTACVFWSNDKWHVGGSDMSDFVFSYTLRAVMGAIALFCCVTAIVLIAITLRCGRAKLHSDELFMRAYGALYVRYDEGAYYWEVVILLRKLLLVLTTKVLSSNQPAQIAGCAVVLGGALALQHCVKPFVSDALDALEEHTLAACVAIVVLGICSQLGMPPIAVTVFYATIMLASAAVIGRDMRAIYKEGSNKEGSNEALPVDSGAQEDEEEKKETLNSKKKDARTVAHAAPVSNPLGLDDKTRAILSKSQASGKGKDGVRPAMIL
jgi:hypothetical protein